MPTDERPLVDGLNSDNPEIRREAVEMANRTGDARFIPDLIEAASDKDMLVRRAARRALRNLGEPAFTKLLESLTDERARVKRFAIIALGKMGDVRAVPLLASMLESDSWSNEDQDVRWAIVEALAEIGGQEAALELTRVWEDSYRDYYKQHYIKLALKRIGEDAIPSVIVLHRKRYKDDFQAYATFRLLGWIGGTQATPYLVRFIHRKRFWIIRRSRSMVIQMAMAALREIGDPAAIPALLKALDDDLWPQVAAEALAKIGGSAAFSGLLKAMQDPRQSIRAAAAGALGDFGNAAATPELLGALHDSYVHVRRAAAKALQRLKDPAALDGLLAASDDDDKYVREYSVKALGAIRNPMAKSALEARLDDETAHIRMIATWALKRIDRVAE